MTTDIDRRSFLKGVGALAGWAVLQAATPASAGLLRGPGGLRSYEVVSLARVRATEQGVALLHREFDLTEHGHDGWYDVVLWPGDRQRLTGHGFRYEILIEDLVAHDISERSAEIDAQQRAPEERMLYRTLAEYEADLKRLADQNPGLVRHFELPLRTHEGRKMYGVEIGGNVAGAATDGRPGSLIMGLHHAREWPSGELTMMFAQDLVDEYAKGTADIVELLDAIRVFVIPVVNPDGFVRSRETVSDFLAPLPGVMPSVASEFAYHRKNMRKNSTAAVELGQGVDPNRNYPYMWGGGGASSSPSGQTYFGPGPGTEPEIANILSILRANQVLTLVTNHTYSNLVLRPWGYTTRLAPDEPQLKELGNAMAKFNGYTSQRGIQLYPTNGTTEDWHYGTCGAFGFTFEIGSTGITGLGNTHPAEGAGFHPQYNLHIKAFYNLNRGAFLTSLRAARNTAYHSVLTGQAPAGTVLTLRKTVEIELEREYEGASMLVENISSQMVVGESGQFTWHVNPSPLPITIDRVTRGELPDSALEHYTIEARLPDGTVLSQQRVVSRGKSYGLSFQS